MFKKISILTFLLALNLIIVSPVLAVGQTRIFTLNQISGTVYVVQKEGGPKVSAVNGMKVGPKAEIITSGNATVKIITDDGGSIALAPNTRLTLNELSTNKSTNAKTTILKAWTGKVFMRTQKLIQKDSRFQVETPNAVAGVRGTLWGVACPPPPPQGELSTQVRVYEGGVAVNGGSVITSMQQATSTGLYNLPQIQSFQAGALDAWDSRQLAGAIQESVAFITQRVRQGSLSPAEQQQLQLQLTELTALRPVVEEAYQNNGLPAPPPVVIPPDVLRSIIGEGPPPPPGNGSGQGGQGTSGQSLGDATAVIIPTNTLSGVSGLGGGSGTGGVVTPGTIQTDDRNQQQIRDQIGQQTSELPQTMEMVGMAAGTKYVYSTSMTLPVSSATIDQNVKFTINANNINSANFVVNYDDNSGTSIDYNIYQDPNQAFSFTDEKHFAYSYSISNPSLSTHIGTSKQLPVQAFDYLTLGEFYYNESNAYNEPDHYINGDWVAGYKTPYVYSPPAGSPDVTADYYGFASAKTNTGTSSDGFSGKVRLTANFTQRTVSGNIDFTNTGFASTLSKITLDGSWATGQNNINLNDVKGYTNATDSTPAMTGTGQALFYGSSGEELGGKYYIHDINNMNFIDGVFAGGRNTKFRDMIVWQGFAAGYKDNSGTVQSLYCGPDYYNTRVEYCFDPNQPQEGILAANFVLSSYTTSGPTSDLSPKDFNSSYVSAKEFNYTSGNNSLRTLDNSAFNYLALGEWNYPGGFLGDASPTKGYWIAGQMTPAVNIPTSGEADYAGTVRGYVNGLSQIQGSLNLHASFTPNADGIRSISGSSVLTSVQTGAYWNTLNFNGSWWVGTNNIYGSVQSSDSILYGNMNGAFFGPNAQEIGGKWQVTEVNNSTNTANGVFGAVKQP